MSTSTRLYKHSNRLPKQQPLTWRTYFLHILAKDAVLWISLALAAASCLVVRQPLTAILGSIDGKTLSCLASLMAASGGFMISGVFDLAAAKLVNRCRTARSLMAALVFATFFASMIITNDVALIVFVPMAILAFKRAMLDPMLTVILQTVAANVGSILLPMGNPQNLYLYSRYSMTFGPFLQAVLPLSLAGAAVLAVFCLFGKQTVAVCGTAAQEPWVRGRDAALYAALFIVAALGVFDVIDHRLALAAAVAVMAWKGKSLIQQVDYALLLTFIGFFVFVGNASHIPAVEAALRQLVEPRPFAASVVASQVISNVPAAVMLSGFTQDGYALLAGVSAGGCGTLIASMASLISYKLYVRTVSNGNKGRYLVVFTLINVLFLAVMVGAYVL
ncbi:MAG: hypothetical protein LUC93_06660 [Planctomycetaceae bacterium]|nr:hypothetical protein [Planctomycetaceae bacterium]